MVERKRFLPKEAWRWVAVALIGFSLNSSTGQKEESQAVGENVLPETPWGQNLERGHLSSRGERWVLRTRPVPESPPESTQERKVESQWFKVKERMEAFPEKFSLQDFEDLEIYFPIYFEAEEKYHLSWFLLWIIHREESQVSRDPEAFTGRNGYRGPMQRDPGIYPENYVDEAVLGVPDYLFKIQTRHPTDTREIYFAAKKLRLNINNSGQEGLGAIWGALHGYSAKAPAIARFEIYRAYQGIFPDLTP